MESFVDQISHLPAVSVERREYAVRVQQLARQVEPVWLRIFGEIAKDVGELQRPAEFCCNPLAGRRRLTKETATATRSQ